MRPCKIYNVIVTQYDYIKLFNFIYCNAYNKGGNEYTALIVKKPMGIIIDSNKVDQYIRIDDVNADLRTSIHPGDALIEIDDKVIIGETYRNIKSFMEAAKVPFTIRLRNTLQYDKFLSTFLKSKKKPTLESVVLKNTVLSQLLHYHAAATIIQTQVRKYLTVIATIRHNKTVFDFTIKTLVDHTIAFYSKKSVINDYYSQYHRSFTRIYCSDSIKVGEGEGGCVGVGVGVGVGGCVDVGVGVGVGVGVYELCKVGDVDNGFYRISW